MNNRWNSVLFLGAIGTVLLVSDLTLPPRSFFSEAEARVGHPLTPVSVAGVGRRTTRRTVYATSAATYNNAGYYDQQAAQTQQAQDAAAQANASAQQAQAAAEQAQATARLPIGSTLPSLPSGCDSTTVGGQSYFTCGGNWYRPAMQGSNIVYQVVANPG